MRPLRCTPPAALAWHGAWHSTMWRAVCSAIRPSDLHMPSPERCNRVSAAALQVTNGKNAMPAWGDRLSEEEIEAVANYVFDQASGNK